MLSLTKLKAKQKPANSYLCTCEFGRLVTCSGLQVTLELGESEASMQASIHALQLDDQSLDAQQPVVLGPASVVSNRTTQLNCAMHTCTTTRSPPRSDLFSASSCMCICK